MKGISKLVAALLIGALLGVWLGVNIGRERPLLSNPFRKESLHEKFRKAGRGFFDSARDAIRESADNFRDKFEN